MKGDSYLNELLYYIFIINHNEFNRNHITYYNIKSMFKTLNGHLQIQMNYLIKLTGTSTALATIGLI